MSIKQFLEGEIGFEASFGSEAIWILPDGEVVRNVGREHPTYVRDNPEDFGLTEEDLDQSGFETTLNLLAVNQGAVQIRKTDQTINVTVSVEVTDEAFDAFVLFLKKQARKGNTTIRIDGIMENGDIGTKHGTVDVRRLFDHDQSIRHFIGEYNDILS